MNDFAVFILTHGRPEKQLTYNALKRQGYTGKVFFVVDDEDEKIDLYKKKYCESVLVFNKKEISKTFDKGDNFLDCRSIVFARNYCFQAAKEIGVTYFLQLDDDYTDFRYKFDSLLNYGDWFPKNLDALFSVIVSFYKKTNAVSVAMAQGGDFIGGADSGFSKRPMMKRKCMNTFFCSTKKSFSFVGRINEDVNTYTNMGSRGFLFLTMNIVAINQKQTQTNSGGMTDLYLSSGTYVKSFYSVMYHPSGVKINMMGSKYKRLHHEVKWKNTVPMILSEKWKKQ